ncbi:GPW/gp25 family protein [Erwinia sp. S38]|uniref:GPW/gp25 family protein n=1 Tax=Erwinia sp. S38 TaxID=2769338 RepID=UPI00190C1185|nr:GPW/gp25 family protein [Erwinia sp. S38]MBK0000229.1 GPW/gp25 family protein [Erwinia sp. S38]
MSGEKYIGMNRDTGETITEIEHIRQSIRDILVTPQGTRIMRREYGSLLSALIDQPQNPALRLKIMSACYMAILRWEPRVTLTTINYKPAFNGGAVVEITGSRADTGTDFSLTVSVS